jgi:hypothetical protein
MGRNNGHGQEEESAGNTKGGRDPGTNVTTVGNVRRPADDYESNRIRWDRLVEPRIRANLKSPLCNRGKTYHELGLERTVAQTLDNGRRKERK